MAGKKRKIRKAKHTKLVNKHQLKDAELLRAELKDLRKEESALKSKTSWSAPLLSSLLVQIFSTTTPVQRFNVWRKALKMADSFQALYCLSPELQTFCNIPPVSEERFRGLRTTRVSFFSLLNGEEDTQYARIPRALSYWLLKPIEFTVMRDRPHEKRLYNNFLAADYPLHDSSVIEDDLADLHRYEKIRDRIRELQSALKSLVKGIYINRKIDLRLHIRTLLRHLFRSLNDEGDAENDLSGQSLKQTFLNSNSLNHGKKGDNRISSINQREFYTVRRAA